MKHEEVRMVALRGLPEIRPGDDLARLIAEAAGREARRLEDRCAVVVAQKAVSKAEGRILRLGQVEPSPLAESYARRYGKDPRLIEVILRQAGRVVRMDHGVIIVETNHGLICANAGVDQSNVPGDDTVTLLPCDPDASAEAIRQGLRRLAGCDCAVVISDTFGRPWRHGQANVAIGVAGFRPLADYRGKRDRHGRVLHATIIAVADELAAAAGLLMAKEAGTPVVLVFGLALPRGKGSARSLVRRPERDLFR